MIELKEALQILRDSARLLGTERVELSDALSRILAEDVASDIDMPPFDKAIMDGYACRRADLGAPLIVVETIPAGAVPVKPIGPNQCAKIMTGAALPQGADCVIMVEQTERVGPVAQPAGDQPGPLLRPEVMLTLFHQAPMPSPRLEETTIRFTGERTADNVSRRATDIQAGQVVLQKGSRIKPQHVAMLASVGCVRPLVAKQPKVGIIASGDELVAPGAKPGLAQIRNSNSPQLVAQLAAMSLKARDYGVVKDVAGDIDAILARALAENDVVILSGGVSVGDLDLVPAALQRNGVELLFEKIAVKPGMPTVFGVARRAFAFGLPGNPVSTFAIFELLVKPFLYGLMGHDYSPVQVPMRLGASVTRKDTDRQSWIPVKISSEETVKPVEYHGSAHLLALGAADGLIPMEIGVASIEQGTLVRVRLL
jgi:molybdopterin molybdotransferase